MSRLIGLGLLLVGLLYPFAVYYGTEHFAPWQFGLLLASLWLLRALTGPRRPGSGWMAVAAIVFCLLLAWFDNPQLLRWYPSLVSVFMLALFGLSLKYGPPMVERLARLSDPQLPEKAIAYTRQVTVAWSVFFLCNGLLAAALTLWAPLSWWTLYKAVITAGLIAQWFAM